MDLAEIKLEVVVWTRQMIHMQLSFQILKAMAVIWAVAPCSLVEIADVSEVFTASIIREVSRNLL
jgi:hypothetical protein